MNQIEEARSPGTASTQAGTRVNDQLSAGRDKSIVRYKTHSQCPHYKGGCIIPDLCRERGIEHCPARTRWCQEINETDQEYLSFCLSHPVGSA